MLARGKLMKVNTTPKNIFQNETCEMISKKMNFTIKKKLWGSLVLIFHQKTSSKLLFFTVSDNLCKTCSCKFCIMFCFPAKRGFVAAARFWSFPATMFSWTPRKPNESARIHQNSLVLILDLLVGCFEKLPNISSQMVFFIVIFYDTTLNNSKQLLGVREKMPGRPVQSPNLFGSDFYLLCH